MLSLLPGIKLGSVRAMHTLLLSYTPSTKNCLFKKIFIYLLVMCLYTCVGGVHIAPGVKEARSIRFPELELQMVLGHLTWVLGIELRSLGRVVLGLNH